MKYNKRLKNETTLVNNDGVETVTSKEYAIEVDAESYYYTFIKSMAMFYDVNCITDVKILAFLCERVQFNTGEVRVTSKDRRLLTEVTGVKTQAISNAIRRLKGLGLIAGDSGVYRVNPEIWWKGSMRTRQEMLNGDGFKLSLVFKKTLKNVNGRLIDMETGEVVK